MKVYSIGREVGCDIVINDSTDVISRRHATLNVTSSGKMTIIDQSHNGTYVNGIRISQNVPVPVTRKDKISFAHVARLDWNMVPKTTNPLMYAIIAVIAAVIVIGGIWGYNSLGTLDNDNSAVADTAVVNKKNLENAKDTLKSTISEANGLKSAITNSSVADTLGVAIKIAQEIYDKESSTEEEVSTATENLRKAIVVAKGKQTSVKPSSQKQKQEKSDKHKDKQQVGKQTGTQTTKSPRKCGTCGKALSECEYKGTHPAKTTSRGDH